MAILRLKGTREKERRKRRKKERSSEQIPPPEKTKTGSFIMRGRTANTRHAGVPQLSYSSLFSVLTGDHTLSDEDERVSKNILSPQHGIGGSHW